MIQPQVPHKPGPLKQQNKSHKHGRHRSKGELDRINRGKLSVKALTKKLKRDLGRQERKNKDKQLRALKREQILMKKRGIGSGSNAPFLICILPLGDDVDVESFVLDITTCDETILVERISDSSICHVKIPRYKFNFTFVILKKHKFWSILDIAKTVDGFIFLHSPNSSHSYNTLFSAILTQGLPSSLHIYRVADDLSLKIKGQLRSQIKKEIADYFPDDKVLIVEKKIDYLNVLRQVGEQKRKDIFFRDNRPYLLAESYEYNNDDEVSTGILKVTGYLRGQTLSANQLVHIPGWGDYQIKKITQPISPKIFQHHSENGMEEDDILLCEPDAAHQEPLESENHIDEMQGEQTWPSEEEIAAAQSERMKLMMAKKKSVIVPEGTSAYQAEWIVEDESGSESEDDSMNSNDEDFMEECEPDSESEFQSFAMETATEIDVDDELYEKRVNFNIDEEMDQLKKIKEAREDQMFPDEIDTPLDVAARIRFQKYRGLKSFRTSPWDCKENLPIDYGRIFQFQNIKKTRRRLLEEERDGAMAGWRVTIHIAGVQSYLVSEVDKDFPLTVFGLLSHEQKMSVCNYLLKRFPGSTHPIKSKEKLIFQVGFRRFCSCPLFSENTGGNKHKFERYFRAENTLVASVFAPLMFPPAGVLVLQQGMNDQTNLIATGNLMSINPDRMIIKRISLSGHPLKIHKKSAVIRYMFFNREDILWFKPIELRTKYGRKGHIKEPLGTHGHMKCIFDGHLNSNDTVLMNLYKRVFPKWTYDPAVPNIEKIIV